MQTLSSHRSSAVVCSFASFAPLFAAQTPHRNHDQRHRGTAENLTSSQDGTVYFGSTTKGTIYRAAPGARSRTLDPGVDGRPDERARRARGRQVQHAVGLPEHDGRPRRSARVGQTALRSFDLKTGGEGHLSVPEQWRRL